MDDGGKNPKPDVNPGSTESGGGDGGDKELTSSAITSEDGASNGGGERSGEVATPNTPGQGGKVNSNAPSSGGKTSVPVAVGTPAKKTPNDFIFGKQLGEGSFSSVYLAKDVKTSKEFAIKVCEKQHIIRERKAESIRREKEVLTILSANRTSTAPFFVHLYATFQDAHRLYFVVTFAQGGELLKYLHKVGSFPLPCCQFYSAEILQALRHLHTIGIVHRDLKPENILLNEHGHILITDFGSAKIISPKSNSSPLVTSPTDTMSQNSSPSPSKSVAAVQSSADGRDGGSGDASPVGTGGRNTRSNSFVGTAQYVSPEVLKGRYSEVGPPADLWAFGCVLYQLVAGSLPFQATNEFLIFQKILKLEYGFPQDFSLSAKDLIEKLLQLEPDERLGAKDERLYESIQGHPFFEGVDFDGLSQQVPPTINSSGEAVGGSSSSRKSKKPAIPISYEPGFDPRVIAERILRNEQESIDNDDEDSDLDDDVGGSSSGDGVSDGLGKLNVAGDSSLSSSAGTTGSSRMASSSRSIQLPQDDNERRQRLEEQLRQNPQSHAAVKGNLILKQGLVSKRKGLFPKKRLLFLTEGPHLYYCEPNSLHLKGEIPWSQQLKPEAKDFKSFLVHTPNRTYNLEDPEGYALEWCRAINEIHQHFYGTVSSTVTSSSNQQ